MRLLLVGAFPYPHHQGSQVYLQEQAIALRAAGCEVDLLTYASGTRPTETSPESWRALDGFLHLKGPAWTAPNSLEAGPSWGKPLADLGLGITLRDAIASKIRSGLRYDAIMTHNAEATWVASMMPGVRHEPRTPVIYCVHTLMGNELSTYPKILKSKTFSMDSKPTSPIPGGRPGRYQRLARVIDRAGRTLDRSLARRVDGWIALTRSASRVMRSASVTPGALIPPPLPDPRGGLDCLDPAATASAHGLGFKSFYLYSGNLDGYQEIETLRAAVAGRDPGLPPIVLASHDPRVLDDRRFGGSGLTTRLVRSSAEMLGLIAAARASLVMRRAEGGFPIKLANSLAVGTPPITFLEREWGLAHGENAWVARGNLPAKALRDAIGGIDQEPALAERLGIGARALYEQNHRPPVAAERTLALVEQVLEARSDRTPRISDPAA